MNPLLPLSSLTGYLLDNLEWMRHRPEAVELADEVADLVKRCKRVSDRPQPRWWAGTCDHATDEALTDHVFGADLVRCRQELYVTVGRDSVTCGGCSTVHTVAQRRAWLLHAARVEVMPAAAMSRALAWLGQDVPSGRIWTWASRGRLAAAGVDSEGRPVYVIGDVMDLDERTAGRNVA